jgi:hypothetical protein
MPNDKVLLSAHCGDLTDDITSRTMNRFAALFNEFVKHSKVESYTTSLHNGC